MSTGIDWDGELYALMESTGIDPASTVRPAWRQRAWRTVRSAYAVQCTTVVTCPAMWTAAHSGAPAAVWAPLCGWGFGWIGYSVWLTAGRPDSAAMAAKAAQLSRLASRGAHTWVIRPARARVRGARITRVTPAATAAVAPSFTKE